MFIHRKRNSNTFFTASVLENGKYEVIAGGAKKVKSNEKKKWLTII